MFCLKTYKIIYVHSVYAQIVFKYLACLVKKKIIIKVMLAFLKTLGINSNNGFESHIKFQSFFRSHWPISPVHIYVRFPQQFSGSQAAFRTTFRFQKAGFQEGFSQLPGSTDFIEAGRNYTLDFLHKKFIS
jgi:hypothetical protein